MYQKLGTTDEEYESVVLETSVCIISLRTTEVCISIYIQPLKNLSVVRKLLRKSSEVGKILK